MYIIAKIIHISIWVGFSIVYRGTDKLFQKLVMHIFIYASYSHSTSECDSSDHPVSVVVVVGVNFFGFSTSSLEPLHGFASDFVWMFLGWTPTKFV